MKTKNIYERGIRYAALVVALMYLVVAMSSCDVRNNNNPVFHQTYMSNEYSVLPNETDEQYMERYAQQLKKAKDEWEAARKWHEMGPVNLKPWQK